MSDALARVMEWARRIGAAALVVANLAAAAYVAYVVWGFTGWPVYEARAAGLSTAGWWQLAGGRMLWSLAAALGLGLVLYLLDRLLLTPRLGGEAKRPAAWMAGAAGALVLLVGLAASVLLVLQRPVG